VIEENDPLEQFIQQATRPDDPFALAPYEVEALRLFWAFAEAAHFPALYLAEYGYTIPAGKEAYLQTLPDIAQVGLLHAAIKQIQAVCSHTGHDTNTHSDMGHDGIVPPTA
jgi:hypothetical protein